MPLKSSFLTAPIREKERKRIEREDAFPEQFKKFREETKSYNKNLVQDPSETKEDLLKEIEARKKEKNSTDKMPSFKNAKELREYLKEQEGGMFKGGAIKKKVLAKKPAAKKPAAKKPAVKKPIKRGK
jgi:uncharacterized phage infection (PIP) family protein YhgE